MFFGTLEYIFYTGLFVLRQKNPIKNKLKTSIITIKTFEIFENLLKNILLHEQKIATTKWL